MRVIYIDEVLVVNFLIDYLALCATTILLGRVVRIKKLIFAASVGALYAAVSTIMPVLSAWPMVVFVALIISVFAFGIGENALKSCVVFVFVSTMFCGATMAADRYLDIASFEENARISLRGLIAAICVCYIVLRVFMNKFFSKAIANREINIKIFCGKKTADVIAIRDTGNRLRDPVTGRGVVVVSAAAAEKMFMPQIAAIILESGQRTADDLFADLSNYDERERFGLIPYSSVGKTGLLLTYRPDRIEEHGEKSSNSLIAFSPTPIRINGKPNVCAIVN